MAKFKIDTDILQTTISTYARIIDDIQNAIKDAERAIDVLKTSGWKTNASKAFFDNFDSSWKKSINDRVKVIKHLKECLENAKRDYDGLCSEASRLGNSLQVFARER